MRTLAAIGSICLLALMVSSMQGATLADAPADSAVTAAKVDSTSEVARLLRLAERGNVAAQRNLGYIYGSGEDYPNALRWLRPAATQGDPFAQYAMSGACLYGWDGNRDTSEAVRWLRLSSDQGYAMAEQELDRLRGVVQDTSMFGEVNWVDCRAAAERGDAPSQLRLGESLIYKGSGWKESKLWARAFVVASGKEGIAEGMKWLRAAADQGLATAQVSLGKIYLIGLTPKLGAVSGGVDQNRKEAERCFKLAAAQGSAEAQFQLGMMKADVTGSFGSWGARFPEARDWFRQAADQGHVDAMVELGFAYCSRKALKYVKTQELVEARKWYRTAADHGNPVAMALLSDTFVKGKSGRDPVQAYVWRTLAALHVDPTLMQRELGPEVGIPGFSWGGVNWTWRTGKTSLRVAWGQLGEQLGRKLTPAQMSEANRLIGAWQVVPVTSRLPESPLSD